MTTFRITTHNAVADRLVVEVVGEDGDLLAVLYAVDDKHLRVVSRLLDRVDFNMHSPAVAEMYLKKAKP
jgi:hypothetical protein